MAEAFDHLLEKYARLVLRVGVNLQPGQRLVIYALPEQADVARALADEAYRVGASRVTIDYSDLQLLRSAVEHAPEEHLGRSLPHELEGIRALKEDRAAVIKLTGNPHPHLMDGLDPARLVKAQPLDRLREYLPIVSSNEINWTVVGAPTPGWAESVLGTADTARLWEAVAVAMRLDEADPVQAWREHLDRLQERARILNAHPFEKVRYRGPGTDLTIGLAPESQWLAAGMQSAEGVDFVANMPTEEVYISPDWRRAEGTARTVAPFFLQTMGALVEDLEIELRDGSITGARASRGEDAVHRQFDSVPRSRHLGEVAIVDADSRVRRTGLTYKDMLFDENVGSHVAWGNGYPTGFRGALEQSPEERIKAGLNQSGTHVDIVIGSPEVQIEGIHRDGSVVPIVQGDEFVLGG